MPDFASSCRIPVSSYIHTHGYSSLQGMTAWTRNQPPTNMAVTCHTKKSIISLKGVLSD
jgi:hypothetical protein